MGARGGSGIRKVESISRYRGAGVEEGLEYKTVHAGVPFYVVCAMDSILWPSRARFFGIPGRGGTLGASFADSGTISGPKSGPRGPKNGISRAQNSLFGTIIQFCRIPTPDRGAFGKNADHARSQTIGSQL